MWVNDIDLNAIDERVSALADAEHHLRVATAARLAAVHRLACAFYQSNDSACVDALSAEISAALHVSMLAADRLLDTADDIVTRPLVLNALAAGHIDLQRACTLVRLLPEDGEHDADGVAYATSHTPHETRRWCLNRTATASKKDAALASAARHIACTPVGHGMAEFSAYLPVATARHLYDTLDKLARNHTVPDDPRTMDQRRADAVELLLDDTTTVTTHVNIVLPATGTGATLADIPAEFGHALSAALAGNPIWAVWLADATGRVTSTLHLGYRVPPAMARTVRARDRHCRFPGCSVPAVRCDIDHTTAWPAGKTTPDNLHCLCRRHHRIKHALGWHVAAHPGNELHWTSPAGRKYTTRPPNQLPRAG